MKNFTLGVSSVVFAAVSALLSNAALAQEVTIGGFITKGTGCPSGTVEGLLTGDPESLPNTLTLLFSQYIAEQGPGIPIGSRRKNCDITVNLNVPPGFSFTLVEAEYKGFADLAAGVTGTQRTSYSFPFNPNNKAVFETVLNGEFTDDYQRNDEVVGAIWSPCGETVPLNLATQVFLSGDRTAPGLMTLDRSSTRVTHIYNFQWRSC